MRPRTHGIKTKKFSKTAIFSLKLKALSPIEYSNPDLCVSCLTVQLFGGSKSFAGVKKGHWRHQQYPKNERKVIVSSNINKSCCNKLHVLCEIFITLQCKKTTTFHGKKWPSRWERPDSICLSGWPYNTLRIFLLNAGRKPEKCLYQSGCIGCGDFIRAFREKPLPFRWGCRVRPATRTNDCDPDLQCIAW